MNSQDILISKSRYMAGLRCDKLLWCTYNAKDLIPAPGRALQGRFTQGHEVGALATRLFPEGVEAAPGKYLAEDVVPATQALLGRRIPIYEAGFVHGSAYVKVDILNPVGRDEWDIYEVKSTTGYSPQKHLADVATQRYAVEGSGLKVRNCYLMHLNNRYVRQGEVDPGGLLTAADVTADVDGFVDRVEDDLGRMLQVIRAKECPEVAVGPHCLEIRECDLCPVCWKDLPEHHPLTLYSGRRLGFELLARGIEDLKDLHDGVYLGEKQRIQVEAVRSGQAFVDPRQVRSFLNQLRYPLSFLDFETLGTAVPLYNGTRPYQNVPFQFSLHVIDRPGGEPVHFSFLAEGKDDPRPPLLEALKSAIPREGSILAYNASFEKGRLRDLAGFDPSCGGWVQDVNARIVDLLIPFQSFAVYHPSQHGSASMKAVLPALTGLNYEGIDMGGEETGYEFIRITFNDTDKEEVKAVRRAMEEYCKMDTEGMIHILKKLKELAG
ncbi:MAG: DUF2779 domain-containing protein [Proteobacteria bacterium]|nr:DUF2779 domain-containing protein [Pseudomonadota bacterium]